MFNDQHMNISGAWNDFVVVDTIVFDDEALSAPPVEQSCGTKNTGEIENDDLYECEICGLAGDYDAALACEDRCLRRATAKPQMQTALPLVDIKAALERDLVRIESTDSFPSPKQTQPEEVNSTTEDTDAVLSPRQSPTEEMNSTTEDNGIALVVILGLPGLGKSYLLKQFDMLLKEAGPELAEHVLMLHKDQLTEEYEHANKGRKPKMPEVKAMILERVQAASGLKALVYNMNMNPDWLKGLVTLFVENSIAVKKVIVLTPPSSLTFRQRQAAAVVLATGRTGDEPADLKSTLPSSKAWEVLMGSFWGDPRKGPTYGKLAHALMTIEAVAETPVVEVHYPVPSLNSEVQISDTPPSNRPAEWTTDNLVFPDEPDFRASFTDFVKAVGLSDGR